MSGLAQIWVGHQVGIVIFLTALLGIALLNWRGLRRLGGDPEPARWPFVSILVPARNEAAKIEACVRSLLDQRYPEFEVCVLDDQSTDGTGEILRQIGDENKRLRVLDGSPLPSGWLGKHWACDQLALAARGQIFVFTDADTHHHPDTLRAALAGQTAANAQFLTLLPQQDMGTWGERLLVPLLPWSLFCFFPLPIAHRVRTPALTTAIGQFMLFTREAYEQSGGHAAVRQSVVDDISLAWRARRLGFRWRLMDGAGYIRCRMYSGFKDAWEGFTKNLFAAFDRRTLLFLAIWSWLALVFLGPIVLLGLGAVGFDLSWTTLSWAAAAVVLALALWGLTVVRFQMPRFLAFLYPAIVFLTILTAFRSYRWTRSGRASWKGRPLPVRTGMNLLGSEPWGET